MGASPVPLMRLVGLDAIFQKSRASDSHPERRIYPYLMKDMTITAADRWRLRKVDSV
jgi:hypothetical protein